MLPVHLCKVMMIFYVFLGYRKENFTQVILGLLFASWEKERDCPKYDFLLCEEICFCFS